jgi:DNA-binding protein H-NS
MPNVNLSRMTIEALTDLRKRVDEMLLGRRAELEKQLERIAVVGGARVVRGGRSALRGTKVPPKYRGPSGETWAGRGSVVVWDLETVPDLTGFAVANDLVGKSDVEVREAIGDKFPKHIYHSIVAKCHPAKR